MPTIIVGDVEVPDVVGDDLATAISELDAVFLAYTTQSQSSAEPAGTVIAQDPAAETEVDPNDPETVVTLTVSSGPILGGGFNDFFDFSFEF